MEGEEGKWLVRSWRRFLQNPSASQVSTNPKNKKTMKSAVRAVVGSSWPEAWVQAISFSGRGSYRRKEEGKSGRRIILINK